MDTYEVKREAPRPHLKYKIIGVLGFAACFFILRFGWSTFFPIGAERSMGLPSVGLEIAISSVIAGLVMVFFSPARPESKYKLLVDEESITGVWQYTGWMRWFVIRRTARKGNIRTIFEIKATAIS